ncbi:hypothetical protein SPONN_312 [uncultured Candidatus Thioglobus sp.]|nr:hypothetical protein SPONN_312 [uncultured Candidatus Thioglobus sp.]
MISIKHTWVNQSFLKKNPARTLDMTNFLKFIIKQKFIPLLSTLDY